MAEHHAVGVGVGQLGQINPNDVREKVFVVKLCWLWRIVGLKIVGRALVIVVEVVEIVEVVVRGLL